MKLFYSHCCSHFPSSYTSTFFFFIFAVHCNKNVDVKRFQRLSFIRDSFYFEMPNQGHHVVHESKKVIHPRCYSAPAALQMRGVD